MYWFEEYIGKPWEAVPNPPHSFTCGELCRWILRERYGLDVPEILADTHSLKDCVRNLSNPGHYGFAPLSEDASPREGDIAYFVYGTRLSHVGMAVESTEGLKILHCVQRIGVTYDSPAELFGLGVRRFYWYRHKEMMEACPCPC